LSRPSKQRAQAVLQIADHLHSASIHLLRRLRRTDVSLGVSGPKLSALSVLVFGGPSTLGALAEAEHVRLPTISRLVDELAREGLVVRQGKPDDRRAVLVKATPRGQELLEEGRRLRMLQLAGHLAQLTPSELRTVGDAVGILERLLLEKR
jgi:DNA-binding MarR family transcriptional regulator